MKVLNLILLKIPNQSKSSNQEKSNENDCWNEFVPTNAQPIKLTV